MYTHTHTQTDTDMLAFTCCFPSDLVDGLIKLMNSNISIPINLVTLQLAV